MADITRLILRDHARMRELFADLDDAQASGSTGAIEAAWYPLDALLDVPAEAEERVFYPVLLGRGENDEAEARDAIEDHNKIRDAVRAARVEQVGSAAWWRAVGAARTENSKHIAEEEREALSDFRRNVGAAERERLGLAWIEFVAATQPAPRVTAIDKDPDAYIDEHLDAAPDEPASNSASGSGAGS
jgi:Hemerythrin HHE cation binding domain